MVPTHALVVLAARRHDAAKARDELGAHGATYVEERPVGHDRVLLYGRWPEEASAVTAVGALRSAGWPAVVRPVSGGHLTAWRNHTRPVHIGNRLWVCFPWSEFDRDEAPAVVEIDTGRAFGTGGHPSTRLLLGALADRLGGGETVLDVGCGSGVLSVSAARLGAASVLAVDRSTDALAATAANAAANDVAARVRVWATPVDQLTGPFDVIVANIGAATLIDMAPALQSLLAGAGWLGLSGLSPAQVSVVAAAYGQVEVVSAPTDYDWAAVICSTVRTTPMRRG